MSSAGLVGRHAAICVDENGHVAFHGAHSLQDGFALSKCAIKQGGQRAEVVNEGSRPGEVGGSMRDCSLGFRQTDHGWTKKLGI